MVAAGDGTLSMVLHWNTRERQSFWRTLLGTRAFILRARTQDGNSRRRDGSLSPIPPVKARWDTTCLCCCTSPVVSGTSTGGNAACYLHDKARSLRATAGKLFRLRC
jgi:hypothetical protein